MLKEQAMYFIIMSDIGSYYNFMYMSDYSDSIPITMILTSHDIISKFYLRIN